MSAPSLNLAQLQAVRYTAGPALVLAGAGSGKTRVITHKIAHLIESGMAASSIAAITFTNKAAAEMRERATALIGRTAREVRICTFHALGVRLLRNDGAALGLKPHFSILDAQDALSLIQDCAGGTTDAAVARQWQAAISALKSAGLNAAAVAAAAHHPAQVQLATLMQRYEERLLAYQCVDFDDLIALPLRLLREHAEVRTRWQTGLGHVLVDEYQDTNATQYELLKLLTGPAARFTAVGDDDQSIYGWRGATLDNLRRLPHDYPQLRVIKLEQNYRSTAAILAAANHVIAHNPKLFPKTLFSELGAGDPIRVLSTADEADQARQIIARIRHLRAASNPPPAWRDFAVLYRANHQARVLEKALRAASIPYRVSGGTSFFDRAEIRDLCAWFRLMGNRADDPAFLRAATAPKRGIGSATLAKVADFAAAHKKSLFDALASPMLAATIGVRAVEHLHQFGREINELEEQAAQSIGTAATRDFLARWLKAIGYEQHLHDNADTPAQAAARWANVEDFCDWMAQRAGGEVDDVDANIAEKPSNGTQNPTTSPKTILDVVRNIALLSTLGERDADEVDQITLSTLHASKGLEWPHVILAGVNEGILPFGIEPEVASTATKTASTSSNIAQNAENVPTGLLRPTSPKAVLGRGQSPAPPSPANYSDDADADEGEDAADAPPPASHSAAAQAERLHEERRLMYVGITRARRTLAVSYTLRRKKGGSSIAAAPSRFIAEMQLNTRQNLDDIRAKLREQRQTLAAKAAAEKPI